MNSGRNFYEKSSTSALDRIDGDNSIDVRRPLASRTGAWFGMGASVIVQGIRIVNPMIYVGSRLKASHEGDDGCLIDPDSFTSIHSEIDESAIHLFPNYRKLSTHHRFLYLQWLASGRSHDVVHDEFLLLFFYGLERRILWDAGLESRKEWEAIANELRRLLKMHEKSAGLFRQKAIALINWMELADNPPRIYEIEPDHPRIMQRPLRLRFALSQIAHDGEPIPAWLALCIVRNDSSMMVGECARLFPNLFDAHFKDKYSKSVEHGLFLKPSTTPLSYIYPPASPALIFNEGVVLAFGDMMEADKSSSVVSSLQEITQEVSTDLQGYMKAVGTDLENQASIEALLSLPASLWQHHSAFSVVIEDLINEVSKMPLTDNLKSFLNKFCSFEKGLNKEKIRSWARSLESLGVGIVPDILNSSTQFKIDDAATLFWINGFNPRDQIDQEILAIPTIIDLSMTVAKSDAFFAPKAVGNILNNLPSIPGYTPDLQNWMIACTQQASSNPLSLTLLKKRISLCSGESKNAATRLSIQALSHQSSVSAAQMKSLKRLYAALGVDESKIFNELNQIISGEKVHIPINSGEFLLDAKKIADLKNDTQQVFDLLTSIFQDDAAENKSEASGGWLPENFPSPKGGEILNLDAKHSAVGVMMLSRSQWTRDQLKIICEENGLLIDGALEALNEASYDLHGIPFTEGDEPIEINPDLVEILK